MDGDIQFGELEESAPQRHRRPDQNRHYAVISYGHPAEEDLPIYVDVDVVRDMEAHALSNTNSELGGVLLGGHYEDDQGQPFVVITDCLRAEHYEATKGSFKFTHETWSDITRKREEFPAEMQMVGWYHTHPGWGVFLSGMDTFICDHFFNKPLDVALVIDPCQGERAFFQWTLNGRQRETRPTRGFYLIASRFRLPELEIYKSQLEGTIAMPSDPRYSGLPGTFPAPIVHVTESRQTWLSVAVLGMLVMQFTVLALIAWRMLSPPDPNSLAAAELQARQLQSEREFLDRVIGDLEVAPEGVVETLEQQRRENEELQEVRMGLSARIDDMQQTQYGLEQDLKKLDSDKQELLDSIDSLEKEQSDDRDQIADLKDRLAEYEEVEDEGEEAEGTGLWAWIMRWKWYLSGGLLLILLAVATAYAFYGPPEEHEGPLPEDVVQDPSQEEQDA